MYTHPIEKGFGVEFSTQNHKQSENGGKQQRKFQNDERRIAEWSARRP